MKLQQILQTQVNMRCEVRCFRIEVAYDLLESKTYQLYLSLKASRMALWGCGVFGICVPRKSKENDEYEAGLIWEQLFIKWHLKLILTNKFFTIKEKHYIKY
jgi:hypothetical protein